MAAAQRGGARDDGRTDRARTADRAAARAVQILARCDALAACTAEPGRITRPFPSPAMSAAQDLLRDWMARAGLEVRTDAVGNVVGRRRARAPDAPVLLIGSHLDSVRDAGRYDGVLGVLVALAALEELGDEPLPFHVDAIAFCDEEGLRFGATFFGSLAASGAFSEDLLARVDADGISLRDALATAGHAPDRIREAAYDVGRTLGFLEVHIEQGPRLEALGAPLGVVTAIAGQTKASVRLEGRAAHAGTTPMDMRRDALAGAAEWALEVEAHARRTPGLVATVGAVAVEPGAVNVIAGAATCTLDVRHEHDAARTGAAAALRRHAEEVGARRGLRVAWSTQVDMPSRPLHEGLAARLQERTGAPRLVSGAGHDAAVMSAFTPTALLFVRSPGGVSHHPDEAVAPGDVAAALAAVTGVVRDLAAERAAG